MKSSSFESASTGGGDGDHDHAPVAASETRLDDSSSHSQSRSSIARMPNLTVNHEDLSLPASLPSSRQSSFMNRFNPRSLPEYDPSVTVTQNIASFSNSSNRSNQQYNITPNTYSDADPLLNLATIATAPSTESGQSTKSIVLESDDTIWDESLIDLAPPPKCAAGKLCRAPSNLSVLGPTGVPAHHCLNCRKPIHCQLFCGAAFNQVSDLHNFTIHLSLLTTDGQRAVGVGVQGANPYESTKEICFSCIEKLRKGTTRIETNSLSTRLEDNTSKNTVDASIDGADEADEGLPEIWNCTWEHIVVSAGETNLVSGKSLEPENLTKLKGFMVTSQCILTVKIKTDHLKKWATKIGISGHRKLKKKRVCEEIVQYRARMEKQSIDGNLEVMVPGTNRVLVINNKRLVNVLFGSIIKPKYAARGKCLKKKNSTIKRRQTRL